MAKRTFAIGDIHGDIAHLEALLSRLPALDADDTIVFLGDYVDRGPDSAEVVALVRDGMTARTPAKIVALKGSHEDAWLKVRERGWPEFVMPVGNGCLATLRSFTGGPPPVDEEMPTKEEFLSMLGGRFLPDDVVAWMASLPAWYEDEHAIYVHAGLPKVGDRFAHPSELDDPKPLIWQRTKEFFTGYDGKRVVFGHTIADALPQELSVYTPEDDSDLFSCKNAIGIDTRCGHGGFLTAIELPKLVVYESRRTIGA
jgi:serine/threonine protein phosphatase 1